MDGGGYPLPRARVRDARESFRRVPLARVDIVAPAGGGVGHVVTGDRHIRRAAHGQRLQP